MKRVCECGCGSRFDGRPDKRYASEACSKRARRAEATSRPASPNTAKGGETVAAVRAELAAAGREETYLGAAALAVAARIDESTAVMGFAALVKELRATMAEAMRGVQVADSRLDELRARRDAKRGA
jgi:hypothetical protein